MLDARPNFFFRSTRSAPAARTAIECGSHTFRLPQIGQSGFAGQDVLFPFSIGNFSVFFILLLAPTFRQQGRRSRILAAVVGGYFVLFFLRHSSTSGFRRNSVTISATVLPSMMQPLGL